MHATQNFYPPIKVFARRIKFSPLIKVFARLFQKAAGSRASRPCRAQQSAKSSFGVFFFVAFSFAPVYAKEKAKRASDFLFCLLAVLGLYLVGELTHMRSMCVGVAETGVGAFDDPIES